MREFNNIDPWGRVCHIQMVNIPNPAQGLINWAWRFVYHYPDGSAYRGAYRDADGVYHEAIHG